MAIDQRIGTKVIKQLQSGDGPAIRVDPYPQIGIVKNNFDPIKAGRLQVWIPEFGSEENDTKSWQTVSYSSPFMGTTSITNANSGKPSANNSFDNVPHTYGMWMVPPDIGVEVICIFINGDPTRGYWMGCVNPSLSRHMIPGLASSTQVDLSFASDSSKRTYTQGQPVPVTEFNEVSDSNRNRLKTPKPIHEIHYQTLKAQGLDRDTVRGTTSSSSQRESPSMVFGISTPGRPLKNDPADNIQEFVKRLNADDLRESDFTHKSRKGGHTFVMDDGSLTGADQLIRLRTSRGHQILMHDTANSVYIAHASGDSWIELTATGRMQVYSKSGIDFRTEGTMNFHADRNINLNAGGNIHLRSGGNLRLNAGDRMDLRAEAALRSQSASAEFKVSGLVAVDAGGNISLQTNGDVAVAGAKIRHNSGGTKSVQPVPFIRQRTYNDSQFDATSGTHRQSTGALSSIALTPPPTHEPYARPNEPGNSLEAVGVTASASTNGQVTGSGLAGAATPITTAEGIAAGAVSPIRAAGLAPKNYTNSTDATKLLDGTPVTNTAPDSALRNQPTAPPLKVGELELSSDEMTAYLAQLGHSESTSNYQAINQFGYVGKYQFGTQALKDLGYIKSSASNANSELRNPNNWKGENGINSLDDFLRNQAVQEQAAYDFAALNYEYLIDNGGITREQSVADQVGMLSVAHLLGAGGANTWRKTGAGADANQTTGNTYFQRGRYSYEVLSPKIAAINAG